MCENIQNIKNLNFGCKPLWWILIFIKVLFLMPVLDADLRSIIVNQSNSFIIQAMIAP